MHAQDCVCRAEPSTTSMACLPQADNSRSRITLSQASFTSGQLHTSFSSGCSAPIISQSSELSVSEAALASELIAGAFMPARVNNCPHYTCAFLSMVPPTGQEPSNLLRPAPMCLTTCSERRCRELGSVFLFFAGGGGGQLSKSNASPSSRVEKTRALIPCTKEPCAARYRTVPYSHGFLGEVGGHHLFQTCTSKSPLHVPSCTATRLPASVWASSQLFCKSSTQLCRSVGTAATTGACGACDAAACQSDQLSWDLKFEGNLCKLQTQSPCHIRF